MFRFSMLVIDETHSFPTVDYINLDHKEQKKNINKIIENKTLIY